MGDSLKQVSALTRVAPAPGATPSSDTSEKFLRFKLGLEGKALLSLSIIHQVMRVSAAEILPVPQMPGCVLGIYNWRGEMLWLVDIGQLLGFPALYGDPNLSNGGQAGEIMAIVVQTNEQYLGLVVPQINDIELHDIKGLNVPSIGLFPPEVLPYLQGYLIGDEREVLMVLNAEAIAQTPLWQVHRQ